MPDYKELYFKMFRASEQAINILIAAQQECEELYIIEEKTELKVISISPEANRSVDED